MNKFYLFGMGTGRCGTVSLSKLLDMQRGAMVTHEDKPWLPWTVNDTIIKRKILLLKEKKASIVGDVSLSNMRSTTSILKLLPNAKFVVLKRDKNQVVRSFNEKWKAKNRNRFSTKLTAWDDVYPYYRLSLAQAIEKYYDEYYAQVRDLQDAHSSSVRCFDLSCLNSYGGVASILEFCEIPKAVIKVGIKKN